MRVSLFRIAALVTVGLSLVPASLVSGKSKLITSWKNPQLAGGHFKKVLVIGMSANPGRRADFEDALSASLATPGAEIIPGNQILLRPDASSFNLDYIKLQVRDYKIDAVVFSRLVSIKDSVTYIPPDVAFPYPFYNSMWGYYGAIYPVVYSPGYLIEDKTVRIETNVYAIKGEDGQLLWTGTSDTFNPKDAQKVIKEVVKLVTQELQKGNVI